MTASERIRQARRAQLIAQYERDGWPLSLVQLLAREPSMTLHEAIDRHERGK